MLDKPITIKPIPTPKENVHPDNKHSILPKHEFTIGLIAPKGAGKTTIIINMLEFYSGYFHEIQVFSPTVVSDDKWHYAKKLKLKTKNIPLENVLKKLKAKKDKNLSKTSLVDRPKVDDTVIENMLDKMKDFIPEIGDDNFYDIYDDSIFEQLLDDQHKMITFLEGNGYSKYLANRVLYIFDDLVCSPLYGSSFFKGYNTRHRHYSSSVFMVSQGYKEIPKTVRTQFSSLILSYIGNDQEVEAIYKEFGMGLRYREWLEVYNYCVNEPHSFMYFNMQKPVGSRIMKNFEEIVTYNQEPVREEDSEYGIVIDKDQKRRKIKK